ncbi:MAG TPA: ABC transporter ATP-binding protein [Dehalococcoidia bacterium]|nr:ABC transporter ATP-binding protein [Dehalococcoidia bacterium]
MAIKGSFHIIRYLLRHDRLRFARVLLLSLVTGILEAVNIAAIYPILTAAFVDGAGDSGIISSMFARLADLLPFENQFISYCVVFLIITVLTFISRIIFINYRVKFATRLVQRNQEEIFDKYMKADYQHFIDHQQGELIYNVVTGPNQIALLVSSVTELLQQAIISITVLIFLFSLSWVGALVVIVIAIGYHFLTRFIGRRVAYYSAAGEREANRETNIILNEVITGIKQVKVYNTTLDWIRRFNNVIRRRWAYYIRRNFWQNVPVPFLFLVLYLAIGVIALLISIMAPLTFTELIPIYGTFGFAIFRLFTMVGTMGTYFVQFMSTLPDCEAIYSIQHEKISTIEDGSREFSSFNSGIRFEDVNFSYQGRTKTLRDISVSFEKGKTVAIVGRSGSGKTTIVSLILRLFQPDAGAVLIDGVELKEYRLSSLLDRIGYVDQDTFIFNDTVRNNITLRSEKYSDEEVFRAAGYADAHDFITDLPQGYDTQVGDKGVRLSGGQKQRIAVARAMIRQPDILIFDEATNALDSVSEAAVQKAIDEISRDHTVIIIAHRLSTVVNADKIIVMVGGRIAEEGTHRELLNNRKEYWQLYQGQVRSDESV